MECLAEAGGEALKDCPDANTSIEKKYIALNAPSLGAESSFPRKQSVSLELSRPFFYCPK